MNKTLLLLLLAPGLVFGAAGDIPVEQADGVITTQTIGGDGSLAADGTLTVSGGDTDTAGALAANGANCSDGSAPLGVDASGAAEGCFDVWTEAENTAAGYLTGFSTLDSDYGNQAITSTYDFGGGFLEVPNSTTLPATCTVGDAYMDTDATSGQRWYLCESTDTWAQQGGILVDDTTPQLGGDLDVNGHKIISASNGNIEIAPNGTGDFFVNTDDLYVDTSTGNIGIGITSPTEKLDVAGTARIDGTEWINTGYNKQDIVINKDGSSLLTHQTSYWNGSAWLNTDGFGLGGNALQNNTGTYSSGFGNQALANNTGAYSSGFGNQALANNTGSYSNGFGNYALANNTGFYSNGFGHYALQNNTGIYSNGFGHYALLNNTGTYSSGFGSQALANNTGSYSSGLGDYALANNQGSYSNGFGHYALYNNTGSYSSGLGHYALYGNTGTYSSGFGDYALYNNTGSYSSGFGHYALYNNTGTYSNGFGHGALANNQGSSNTALGQQAGYNATYAITGANNTFLGANSTYYAASADSSITNSTAVGANITLTDSNTVILGSGANVGIGTTSPDTKLDVNGAITARELSSDPADPDEGSHVCWQSDGTGTGDDGDIICKITAGGVTKTTTLFDFSTL